MFKGTLSMAIRRQGWVGLSGGICLIFLFNMQSACAQAGGTLRDKIRDRIVEKTADPSQSSDDTVATIEVGGLKREYLLHVPLSYKKGKPVPLVLVFHGGKSRAENMASYTQFNAIADREGFILAYPDGIKQQWNDGRKAAPNVDDVGFVRALIAELGKTYAIDRTRIYAAGISNGGMFSQRLGCEFAGTLAGVASVAASMPEDLAPRCNPSKPISVLMIHGTDDPLVPFAGGNLSVGSAGIGGRVRPVRDTVKFWVGNNRCASEPVTILLPDKTPDDGTRVRRETYAQCAASADVYLYTIEGGGHTWPSARQYLPERLIGKTSKDIDASEVIWDFFAKHPMK